MNRSFVLIPIILSLLIGCRDGEIKHSQPPPQPLAATAATQATTPPGCVGCHPTVQLDPAHRFACTSCHHGVDNESKVELAHQGLIAQPAHPDHMAATCGGCHPQQLKSALRARHFTLAKEIHAVREHFGARENLATPTAIPQTDPASSPLALADDMLRRHCLRCHVFSKGDDYSAVRHGTGCSACHLAYKSGKLVSHAFAAPKDQQCLSCHYGNYVGNDYYGRYEHDFSQEYRTPYFAPPKTPDQQRPYGVEQHDLVPDIHQQRGLVCLDCHQESGHPQRSAPSCRTCHGWQAGQPAPALSRLEILGQSLVLHGRFDGKEHQVPPMRHPAHERYGAKVDCQVCHAQWSFNDAPTSFLLSSQTDVSSWDLLTVQSSSQVEAMLTQDSSQSGAAGPTMRDGLTGVSRPGIWYLGYGQRRWEQMRIAKDSDGVIKVFRPILDLRLSMITADGQVPFDNLTGHGNGQRPYTPHTTGPAGMFYQDRFRHLLPTTSK